MSRVVYRAAVARDLGTIENHIAEWAPVRALTFIDELQARCESLRAFPERGGLRPDILPGLRQLVLAII